MDRSALILLFIRSISIVSCAAICHRGYCLHTSIRGNDSCLPCSGGTFMPEDNHRQRACHECTCVEEPFLEYVASECNATHDAVIRCKEGYYRSPPLAPDMKGKCNKCTECDHPVYKCQGNQDTVCCPSEGYGVGIDTNGNPVCSKRCLQGEYLEANSSKCLPCPEETFLTALEHTSTQCNACPKPTPDLEIVLLPCTRKEPTLLGCVKGYYRQQAENSVEDICVRCTNCSNEGGNNRHTGRQCDYFRDTVCCSEPNMAVVDTPEGTICKVADNEISSDYLVSSPVTCGADQYLYIDNSNDFRICLSCPANTYMNYVSHTNSSCKECADGDGQYYSACQIKLTNTLQDSMPNMNVVVALSIVSLTLWLIIILVIAIVILKQVMVKLNKNKSKEKTNQQINYEKMLMNKDLAHMTEPAQVSLCEEGKQPWHASLLGPDPPR